MTLFDLFGRLADNQIASTAILIAAAFAVKFGARKLLSREKFESDYRRRMLSNLRNTLFFILLFGIALIWAPALRTFALSLTAFTVALILATKELILCLSGATLKATSRSMRVGDWIEIGGYRGEVVDQNIMSTTLQELGKSDEAYEFTGRTAVLPNSIFLTAPVFNEQFYKRYIFHHINMVVENWVPVEEIAQAMIDVVNREMEERIELARRYLTLIEKKAEIDLHNADPDFKIIFKDDGRVKISVVAFLPTRDARSIEKKALLAGSAKLRQLRPPENKPAKEK